MVAMSERTPGHPDTSPADTRRRTGEPPLAAIGSWLVLSASFGLSAATWIALATLAGFDGHLTTPLGLSGYIITVRLAWLMPVAIDGYVVVALVLWTAPVPPRIAAFARKNTYAGACVGVVAQSAYHALTAWSATGVLWRALLAAVVGAIVPGVAALTVHLRALVRRESGRWRKPDTVIDTDTQVDTPGSVEPDTAQVALPVRVDIPADIEPDGGPDTEAVAERTPEPPVRINGTVTPLAGRTRRNGQGSDVPVDDLADTLGEKFKDRTVGQPTALAYLKQVHGSCSRERAIAAKNLHNARVTGQVDAPPVERADSDNDQERVSALVDVG